MTIAELKSIINDIPDDMDVMYLADTKYGIARHKLSSVKVTTVGTVEGDIDVVIIS